MRLSALRSQPLAKIKHYEKTIHYLSSVNPLAWIILPGINHPIKCRNFSGLKQKQNDRRHSFFEVIQPGKF